MQRVVLPLTAISSSNLAMDRTEHKKRVKVLKDLMSNEAPNTLFMNA